MQQTKQATILVVDDDGFSLKLLSKMLALDGHAVRTAASGEQAFASVAEQLPDLVLLDVMMPGIDGLEVTRRFKADPRTRPIPIILVTALEDGDSRIKGLEAGAEEFLSKPVNRAELQMRVKNLLKLKEFADYLADHNRILEEQVQQRTASLIESENKLRRITESAQDAIVMVDNSGNISFWNAAAEKIFGYPAHEALGKNLHQLLVPPKYREASHEGFSRFMHSGEGAVVGTTRELAALHKNGAEFPVELSLSAVKIDGAWQGIGIVRDITERKKMEKQAVEHYEHVANINTSLATANQQLQQAQSQLLQSEKMAAIGNLAAGVAHEINNPVGYVNSNLGTLEKYLADIFAVMDKCETAVKLDNDNPLLGELRQFMQKIDIGYLREDTKALVAESHQGLERVKRIVLDLKNFSRADTDEQWVQADLNQGMEATLNVVWNELKYKCEVVKEYGVLPEIDCLPSQLDQVFLNLLVNAAQAIEVRGKITIRTGQEGDRVWVEVGDTGKGIPPENIPHLFEPFFTTKPVGQGTGLGLSVSFNIVAKHHGKIEVRSEVGKGSTFRVWLPVQQPDIKETV
ncbi:MAG: PAS domain S-box protein [Gallionella sp.]|nr:PAS domain S-box protein [Gallionella sp.]